MTGVLVKMIRIINAVRESIDSVVQPLFDHSTMDINSLSVISAPAGGSAVIPQATGAYIVASQLDK